MRLVSIEHTGDHLCHVVDSWTQVTDQVTGGSDEGGGGGGGGGRRYSVSICVPICVPNCVPICVPISVSVESVSISAAMA